MTKIVPFKDTRTEEEKYSYRKMIAQNMKDKIYRTWKEAKSAKRWDANRECYLDPKGNIVVEPSSVTVETLIEQLAEEEEERQRLWWGTKDEEKEKEKDLQLKKVNDGIIDTTKEFTADNLKNMADKVLAAKELEVDSKSSSESQSKVSSNDLINGSGKTEKAKRDSDYKNCMKNCKVCSTHAYLSGKRTEELTERVRQVENQILSRDKLLEASNERIKELTDKLEKDKIEVEKLRKENEKLIHENRQLFENHEKLKKTIKDSDERNSKTSKENQQLSGVLQSKEKQINQQLDEIANLKLHYNSASFVLQHIVPKPIGKNKVGEDVYSDGTRVGYHQVPPPVLNNFSKKKSGLVNEDETHEVKLPETIDVTFTSSSDKDSGSDKLYSDLEFPLENVNVDKLELPRSISRWVMDSGASRHMTGKKTLLYDVRGFNGGYVGFAGNQGGRIVGEGTLSNGIVTFERVNYIAELENNLLSFSQICDRISSVSSLLYTQPGSYSKEVQQDVFRVNQKPQT
ncbi:uncharacterized protein PFB0145c-like [Helianthus annuus]|uniref:uncharacterized protein PFB0145c-like n=1 Tax=Helianthus annuus TaxID=4232 RepID=UPI000B90A0C7|nr:uncharacterized protein PFB0145c-like [Helianthus annuus]